MISFTLLEEDLRSPCIESRINEIKKKAIQVNGLCCTLLLMFLKESCMISSKSNCNGGGLKFGEMERDALVAHGIWGFIKESYIERCDKFIVQVSKSSGEITISNPEKNLYYDDITDGITSYQLDDNVGHSNLTKEKIMGVNMYGQKSVDFINLVVPYTFKILLQEMQGMCMSVKLNVNNLKKNH